jgi:hypothetical protein
VTAQHKVLGLRRVLKRLVAIGFSHKLEWLCDFGTRNFCHPEALLFARSISREALDLVAG